MKITGKTNSKMTRPTGGGGVRRRSRLWFGGVRGYRNVKAVGDPAAVENTSGNRHRNRDEHTPEDRLAQIGAEQLCRGRGCGVRRNNGVRDRERSGDQQAVVQQRLF